MKKEKQRGSLTVEAALFLVLFLAAFLTLLNFARTARVQVVMQHAINSSAMQISQYGYILSKTGVIGHMGAAADLAGATREDVGKIVSAANQFAGAVENVGTGTIDDATIQMIADAALGQGEMGEAAGIAENYFKEPKGLLTGLASIAVSGLTDRANTFVIGKIAKAQVESYLEEITDDPDEYLKGIGIVDGLSGLRFEQSKLTTAGNSKDLDITVRFKVKNQMFPMLDFGEHEMCINASTRLW